MNYAIGIIIDLIDLLNQHNDRFHFEDFQSKIRNHICEVALLFFFLSSLDGTHEDREIYKIVR